MKKIVLIIALSVLGFSANAEPSTSDDDGTITLKLKMNNSSNSAQSSSPRKSRLKFKDRGPTCLCADGLSEKDILEQQLIKQQKES